MNGEESLNDAEEMEKRIQQRRNRIVDREKAKDKPIEVER